MQLKSLRMFEAVCESGSFGAAAQQLHTVQSNVTAHIKKLEDETGAQLLARASPVHPTPAGRALRAYAQRMLREHDQALAQLQAVHGGGGEVAGLLRIGSMESTAATRLPDLLAQLRTQHPGISLELTAEPTASLLAALAAGRIDCAFISGAAPQPELHSWRLFEEELVLVSAQPLARFPTAGELGGSVFLAFRQGCSYRQRIELLMSSMGVSAVRIMELGMLDTICGCVAAGMGHALLPLSLVESQRQRFGVHWLALPGEAGARIARVETFFATGAPVGWSPALGAFARVLGVEGGAVDRAACGC